MNKKTERKMTGNTAYIGEIQKNQSFKGMKQNKYFKSEAKRALFAADNLYKAVIAHFLCGVISGGFLYMTFFVPDLSVVFFADFIGETSAKLLSTVVTVILAVLFSFFLFAFFLGAYTFSAGMRSDTDSTPGAPDPSDLSELLSPVNSMRHLGRTLTLYFIYAFEIIIAVSPSVFVILYSDAIGIGKFTAALMNTVAVACSLFIFLFFTALLTPLPYVLKEDDGIGAFSAYKKSAAAAMCGIWRIYSLFFSFIPLILVSALTFGVLYFAYSLPYMTAAFAKAGEYLYYIENPERRHINE